MITVKRLNLMSYVDLFEFINDTYKAFGKAPPPAIFNTELPYFFYFQML